MSSSIGPKLWLLLRLERDFSDVGKGKCIFIIDNITRNNTFLILKIKYPLTILIRNNTCRVKDYNLQFGCETFWERELKLL